MLKKLLGIFLPTWPFGVTKSNFIYCNCHIAENLIETKINQVNQTVNNTLIRKLTIKVDKIFFQEYQIPA